MISGRMYQKVLLILLIAGLYATVRYVVFGKIGWQHIPMVILNKTMAVAAVFTLMLSAIGNLKGQAMMARDWGVITLHITLYHVLLSIMIMAPEYYEGFYLKQWPWLNLKGNLVMSFGALGTYCVVMLYKSRAGTMHMATFKVLTGLAVGAHIYFMAWRSWFDPGRWYGHMPPISLWSFIFTVVALAIYLRFDDARNAAPPVIEGQHS